MELIFALFESYEHARNASYELLAQGIGEDDMNAVAAATAGKAFIKHDRAMKVSRIPDGKTEALGGKSLFGIDFLLAGEKPIHTSDCGDLIAGGTIATILMANVSQPENTFKRILNDLHIDTRYQGYYIHGIGKGNILFWIRAEGGHINTAGIIFKMNHGRMISSSTE